MKINRKQTKHANTKIRRSKKPAAAARPVEQRKLAVIMFTDMVDYLWNRLGTIRASPNL